MIRQCPESDYQTKFQQAFLLYLNALKDPG